LIWQLQAEFNKLGSEAAMATKVSTESFKELSLQAQNDFQDMKAKHDVFVQDVQAGDKQAADAAKKDWDDATKKFQEDWDAAKQKANQDMQEIKSNAQTISSDLSGILNDAISGKLNWGQEMQKILSQMIDMVVKYVTEMVAMMIAGNTMAQASETASHGNMLGELINYFIQRQSHQVADNAVEVSQQAVSETSKTAAQQVGQTARLAIQPSGNAEGLALQKAGNVAAGSSDAVTAAKGAYSSASQVPYIGWILGPIAAAAAFSGVEAFGSAQHGADIAPGLNPMMQLHSREMVLPADIAGGMRDMIRGGNQGGGGGNKSVTNHVNIHALDSQSVAQLLSRNPSLIAELGASAMRSGFTPYMR
jgi:hypothetical protein